MRVPVPLTDGESPVQNASSLRAQGNCQRPSRTGIHTAFIGAVPGYRSSCPRPANRRPAIRRGARRPEPSRRPPAPRRVGERARLSRCRAPRGSRLRWPARRPRTGAARWRKSTGTSIVTGIGSRVGLANELEDAGHRVRGVEVVVHPLAESGNGGPIELHRFGAGAGRRVDDGRDHRRRVNRRWAEAPGHLVETVQCRFGLGNRLRSDLDGRSVVGLENEQPVGPWVTSIEQVAEGREVAQ